MKVENVHGNNTVNPFPGDLRDYFAGQALAGTCANPDLMQTYTSDHVLGESFFPRLATKMYELAEAMLAEREKADADV